VIELEHNQLRELSNSKWEALYKEREKLEVGHMEKKFQAVDRHEDEIYRIAVEHHEKLREVKIKLQTDIQVWLIHSYLYVWLADLLSGW
jgi:excinuclease UvrABC nuclease subunit